MHLGSIVLAGGRSRRLGKPKVSLPWGESTLLYETVVTLLDCTFPVVVVARDERQELPPLHTECELAFDGDPGGGPLVICLHPSMQSGCTTGPFLKNRQPTPGRTKWSDSSLFIRHLTMLIVSLKRRSFSSSWILSQLRFHHIWMLYKSSWVKRSCNQETVLLKRI